MLFVGMTMHCCEVVSRMGELAVILFTLTL